MTQQTEEAVVKPSSRSRIELYVNKGTKVTPSWLTLKNSHYAIRTIMRLEYKESNVYRNTATAVFFFALFLIVYCIYRFLTTELPDALFLILQLCCVGLWLFSGWFAFVVKPKFRISIVLIDGERVVVNRTERAEAQGLLSAVRRAMDWHRSDEVVLQASRQSHVRRSIAKKAVEPDTQLPAEQKAQKRRKIRRMIPLLPNLMKDKHEI